MSTQKTSLKVRKIAIQKLACQTITTINFRIINKTCCKYVHNISNSTFGFRQTVQNIVCNHNYQMKKKNKIITDDTVAQCTLEM